MARGDCGTALPALRVSIRFSPSAAGVGADADVGPGVAVGVGVSTGVAVEVGGGTGVGVGIGSGVGVGSGGTQAVSSQTPTSAMVSQRIRMGVILSLRPGKDSNRLPPPRRNSLALLTRLNQCVKSQMV